APLAGRRRLGKTRAWLEYAGARGRVVVRSQILTLDDVQSAVASNGAVLAVEWDGRDEFVRLAWRTPVGWRLTTLPRNAGPVWTARVAVTRRGTTLAGWIDDTQSERRLLVASVSRSGAVRIDRLDAGQGLGSYTLRPTQANGATVTWDDAVAAQ